MGATVSQRGEAKRLKGDYKGAITDFDESLQLEPQNGFALSRRGAAKCGQGDYVGGMADFDKSLQLEPENVFALNGRGAAKCKQGDYVGGMADFDKSLQLEPKDAFALSKRGVAKCEQGDYVGGVADFDKSLQLEPQNVSALNGRGAAKCEQGDYVGGMADFDKSLQLEPKDAWALTRRGLAKCEQGDYVGGVADFDKSLQLEPQYVFALNGRGVTKWWQGDYAGAIADFDKFLQLEPKDAVALSLQREVAESEEFGWFVQKADSLRLLQNIPMSHQAKWAIVGAGPVGITLALSLAESMQSRGLGSHVARVGIYESRWIEQSDDGVWRRNGRRARDQVVTLQDSVVELLSPDIQSAFEGENVWLQSRNVPVAEIEERLLKKAQQAPYNKYIRIHQCDLLSDEQQHAEWIKGLDAHFVVAADGAASLSRRAFPDAFVYCVAEGANRDAQQIRLGETAAEFDEADYALGIALKPETTPPQKQALNVVLTLAQNVYLLNSQEGSRGFLNIRVTKEEYDAIFLATGNIGCTFGSPIRLFKEEDLYLITDDQPNEIKVQLPWLRRRIEEGLKLFGMQLDHMQFITGFQLRPSYAHCYYHVLPSTSSTAKKVLLLAGDAAISHHFWPGRGLNTGLKSAAAIVKMWCQGGAQATVAEGLKKHNIFMDKLRQREMQGRSASMMRNEMRLPWGSTLLSPKSPEAQQLKRMAVEQEPENRQKFLKNCQLWRDFLERSQGWPHERLTDKALKEKIVNQVIKPKELELYLMLSSAFDNGPGRAAGWPTSKQGGAEVDPSHEKHWK